MSPERGSSVAELEAEALAQDMAHVLLALLDKGPGMPASPAQVSTVLAGTRYEGFADWLRSTRPGAQPLSREMLVQAVRDHLDGTQSSAGLRYDSMNAVFKRFSTQRCGLDSSYVLSVLQVCVRSEQVRCGAARAGGVLERVRDASCALHCRDDSRTVRAGGRANGRV